MIRCATMLGLFLVMAGCAGTQPLSTHPTSADTDPTAADTTESGPKPYDDVVTEEALSDEGLFTTHRLDDGETLLYEVPDSLLGRGMLLVSRMSRAPEGLGYGGEKTGTQMVRWERVGTKLQLRTVQKDVVAADSLPIYRAVRNATFEPVIARLDIEAVRADSARSGVPDSSYVINVSSLYTGDVPVFGLPQGVKERVKTRRLDTARSYLSRAASYPENVEIRAVLTYEAGEPPEQSSTGTLSVEMAHSMVLLPAEPMRPRRADERVGYFSITQTDYGLDAQRAEDREYITRWRLEPSDEAAYARGELVEPKEPITYYLDPATPEKWRPYLCQGVEDWDVAFEAAGFANAVRCAMPPENDPDWSPEDVRYSVIRYFPSDIPNAYGPHVHDPRSGEIIESDIGWYHNVMNLLRNWFFVQTAAANPDARAPQFDDAVMGQLIRFVSAHEVGHTLGLPHNWISSAAVPVDSLRSPTYTATNGTAPSIMDYARFNYVAQPGDGVTNFYPRVGPYDIWSVDWGYRYFPGAESVDEERKMLQERVAEKTGDPIYQYGPTAGDPIDPRSQREDLGDDAVYASELGLANLKRIAANLTDWAVTPGEPYDDLEELYGEVVTQWGRYLGHVAREVGGIERDVKIAGQEGMIYTPVPAERQRRAVDFLVREGFEQPDWLLRADILRRIEAVGAAERVAELQERALTTVLDTDRLGRVLETSWLAESPSYTADALLADLRTGLWEDVSAGRALDASQRMLHRAHVDRLGEILTSDEDADDLPAVQRSDLQALARGELVAIQDLARRAQSRYRSASERVDRLHLSDVEARIERMLSPEYDDSSS